MRIRWSDVWLTKSKCLLPAERTDQRFHLKRSASFHGSEVERVFIPRIFWTEHQFRDVPVSKGTTWKRAGIPEEDTETKALV